MCISRKTFTIGILVTVFIACMIFRADNVSAITGDKDYLTLLSYNGYGTEIKLSGIKDVNTVTCECSNDDVADVSTNGWTVFVRPKKAGEATITVRQNDDEPFICSLNVVAPEVSFRHDEIVFDIFENKEEFGADSNMVEPDNDLKESVLSYPETDDYSLNLNKWEFDKITSSNSSVLLVHSSKYGSPWFEIFKAGTAILTGTTKTGVTAQCKITVTQNYVNQRKAAWQKEYDKEVYADMKKLIKDYPYYLYEKEYYCPVGYEDSPIKTKLIINGKTYKKGKYVKNKAQIAVSHYLKGDKLIVKVGKKKYTWKIKKDCRKPFDPKKKTSPYRGKVKYKFKVPGYNKNTKMKIYMKDKYNKVFYKRNVVGDWIK